MMSGGMEISSFVVYYGQLDQIYLQISANQRQRAMGEFE